MFNEYKDKIINFYQKYRRMPSYSEIMKIVGFKSKNAVHKLVDKLVESGMVSKDKMGKLIPNKVLDEIKVLGFVKAGFPSATEEELQDTMSLDEFLIDKRESTYMLEVDGDSMIDAHIEDGDMVIVEKTAKANDGDIVIAEVDGDWTMKYFRQKGARVWLEPANKNFKPIYPEGELRITAKVKAVIRKY